MVVGSVTYVVWDVRRTAVLVLAEVMAHRDDPSTRTQG
jgi:hypothetical protein